MNNVVLTARQTTAGLIIVISHGRSTIAYVYLFFRRTERETEKEDQDDVNCLFHHLEFMGNIEKGAVKKRPVNRPISLVTNEHPLRNSDYLALPPGGYGQYPVLVLANGAGMLTPVQLPGSAAFGAGIQAFLNDQVAFAIK